MLVFYSMHVEGVWYIVFGFKSNTAFPRYYSLCVKSIYSIQMKQLVTKLSPPEPERLLDLIDSKLKKVAGEVEADQLAMGVSSNRISARWFSSAHSRNLE
jgi:hypothetical protein